MSSFEGFSDLRRFQDFENLGFGHEMGRRGSEWAHT